MRRAPPGWRSATPTTAATCWPPRWSTPSASARRRLAQGAAGDRDANRPGAARDGRSGCCGNAAGRDVAEAIDNPARYLRRRAARRHPRRQELELLALMRLAASDAELAAAAADTGAERLRLRPTRPPGPGPASAEQAAMKLSADAAGYYAARLAAVGRRGRQRSAARAGATTCWPGACAPRCAARRRPSRWPLVLRAIDAMSAAEQRDATWVYWRARALAGPRRAGPEGDAARAEARRCSVDRRRRSASTASWRPRNWAGRLALPPRRRR